MSADAERSPEKRRPKNDGKRYDPVTTLAAQKVFECFTGGPVDWAPHALNDADDNIFASADWEAALLYARAALSAIQVETSCPECGRRLTRLDECRAGGCVAEAAPQPTHATNDTSVAGDWLNVESEETRIAEKILFQSLTGEVGDPTTVTDAINTLILLRIADVMGALASATTPRRT